MDTDKLAAATDKLAAATNQPWKPTNVAFRHQYGTPTGLARGGKVSRRSGRCPALPGRASIGGPEW